MQLGVALWYLSLRRGVAEIGSVAKRRLRGPVTDLVRYHLFLGMTIGRVCIASISVGIQVFPKSMGI